MIKFKKLKKTLAIVVATAMAITTGMPGIAKNVNAQESAKATTVGNQKIIGYFPSWYQGSVDSQIQFDKLTHINYAFLIPNKDGSLVPIENEPMMKEIISKAHSKGVKVLISVGGWSYKDVPLQSTFESLARNTTSRNAFVKNVVNFVNQYGFDGADIDWEYPTAATANNFQNLMTSLRTELNKTNKLLTAAVSAGVMPNGGDSGNGSGVNTTVINSVDWLNVMAYDGGNGADHSQYSFAENALNYWLNNKKVPKEKINLGVPFYARPSWDDYKNIVARDPQAPYKDQSGNDYYNGIDTIKRKANLAKEKVGGIMIWEISEDTMDNTSLLSAIYSVLGNGGGQELAKPLQATLNHDNNDYDGNYNIKISIPSNSKATSLSIKENGVIIDNILLDGITSKVITKEFSGKVKGSYKYSVTTSNEFGTTVSEEITVIVNGEIVQPSNNTKVIGYFTDWTDVNIDSQVQFDKLTHINYAFLIPMEDGSVRPLEQPAKFKELVEKAHRNGVKVLISVGGWSYHDAELDPVFVKLAANETTRENLVNNIVRFVNENNLDGADIDWEYPDPGSESDNFDKLMTSLNAKLKPSGKLLTAAVTAGTTSYSASETWTAQGIKSSIFPLLDWINIMAYDGGNGADHSPYSYAENAMTVWTNKGLPKEKMVLGLPFYARPSWDDYKTIVAKDPQAPYKDQSGQNYYNGIETIKKKTQLALNKGSGVMIWEISEDTTDDTSLLKAINMVTGPVHGGETTYDVADFNKDGKVDSIDLSEMAGAYNEVNSSKNWNVKYDLNKDNIIDIYDLVSLSKKIS
ncbi:glycosyl hydrolase family 18 protein [Clostridium paraputrificum]|uniref:glycosyl hydrolase family 18 protein n=1 Tax=Clostridium TaxID=1485 RepID=UPI003D351153